MYLFSKVFKNRLSSAQNMVVKYTVFISTALQQKHFLYVHDTGMQS